MSEIEPALSAEEWASGYESADLSIRVRNSMGTVGPRLDVTVRARPLGGALGDERDIHALAALALHGQPFGFTWKDVDDLREVAREVAGSGDIFGNAYSANLAARVEDTVDRIAALLPPRER